jgi:anti-sigma factor RsiW
MHDEARSRLSEFLDGTLRDPDRDRIGAHLAACEACRREARELERTVDLLRVLPREEPPPALAAAVMARIRGHEPGLLERLRLALPALSGAPWVAPVAALSVALALVMLRVPAVDPPRGPIGNDPTGRSLPQPGPGFGPSSAPPFAIGVGEPLQRTPVPSPWVAPGARSLGASVPLEPSAAEQDPFLAERDRVLEGILLDPDAFVARLEGASDPERRSHLELLVDRARASGRAPELARALRAAAHPAAPRIAAYFEAAATRR